MTPRPVAANPEDDDSGSEGHGGDHDKHSSDKKSDAPEKNSQEDKDRRRLYSYLLPASSANGGNNKDRQRAYAQQERNEETEAVGGTKLKALFGSLNVQCKSVEDQHLGYDFVVTVHHREVFIELKASRDRWDGWEHSLTPNEFRAAQEKGEDYYLCVVDRVLENDSQFYFIKNPAAQVDGYLFDSPWKQLHTPLPEILKSWTLEEGFE